MREVIALTSSVILGSYCPDLAGPERPAAEDDLSQQIQPHPPRERERARGGLVAAAEARQLLRRKLLHPHPELRRADRALQLDLVQRRVELHRLHRRHAEAAIAVAR